MKSDMDLSHDWEKSPHPNLLTLCSHTSFHVPQQASSQHHPMFATAAANPNRALRTVSVTGLLNANDPSLWKLILVEPPHHYFNDFSAFCDALKQNKTVSFVKLACPFLLVLTAVQRAVLLGIIGNLPGLEKLVMGAVRSASMLTTVLRNASKLRRLRSLWLWKLRFSSNKEIAELVLAMKGCTALQEISLSSLQVLVQGDNRVNNQGLVWFQETESSNDVISLDPLIEAMASLPKLEHIRLRHHLNGGRIQPPSDSSLRMLCQSPRKNLDLYSCGLSDKQCLVIASELQSNDLPLSVLNMSRNNQLSRKVWGAFIDTLEVNPNLMDFRPAEDGQSNTPSCDQLAKIKYYVQLNQHGRKGLLCGPMAARRKAWFDFLVRGSSDLDLIFFALQVDPSFYS